MFLAELSPLVQELTRQPAAFLGGLMSGLLRLSLTDDPVKSWLDNHNGTVGHAEPSSNKSGPQSINID